MSKSDNFCNRYAVLKPSMLFSAVVPKGDTEGSFIFRAAYADRGTKTASSQSSEATIVLRNPVVPVTLADQVKDISFNNDSTMAFVRNSGASFRLKGTDLTGIKHIEIVRAAGRNAPTPPSGTIEAHAGSADGVLLGKFSGEYSDKMILDIATGAISGVKDIYFVFTGAPIRIKAVRFGAGE